MERMSSIELAIKNEKSEMEYYLAQANRSKNPVAKALFETLAEDEKEHMTRLTGLHEKLIANGKWPEDVSITVAGTNVRKVLDKVVSVAGSAENHDTTDLDALRQGVKFESNGHRFYKELSEVCDNPKEAEFFRFLAGIEREHMLSIQDSLYYLEDPEGWIESKSRSGLDGA